MKITIYELLGLIKDDKAPLKIRIFDKEYKYNTTNELIDYSFEDEECKEFAFLSTMIGENYLGDIFSIEVEIIEEKPKHIEKIDLEEDAKKQHFVVTKQDRILENKINELRKAVNYLLDKEER